MPHCNRVGEGPLTYNTAAEYSVKVEPAPIHMVRLLTAVEPFGLDAIAPGFANADGARIDVERNGNDNCPQENRGRLI